MRATWRRQAWILVVLAAGVGPVWAQDTKKAEDPASQAPVTKTIRGQVVDGAGKPVPGITLSTHWFRQEDQPVQAAANVATTDDRGQFRVDLTFYYGRSYALCALDVEKKRGGLAAVGPKTPDEPITIRVGPLVHVRGRYVCKELGTPVGWTNTTFQSLPENWPISNQITTRGAFSVLIPPGRYQFLGYGGPQVAQHRRELTLKAGEPDVDLGEINLAASELAKLKGKPAPTLHPTDVRGASKGVQIADYKGKWVALEFWGHWCGPCVAGAIPRMLEIYDDHPGERDKYVVLTVHSALQGKTFAEVDEKLVPVVRDIWGGRMIPFPILLDADGKMQETFGVDHWPTTILFDPEGKLVGEVQPDDLEKKLEPVPLAVALPRQLDRNTNVYFKDGSLKQAIAYLEQWTRAEYELDREALASLPNREETKIPLTIAGQVSLRSALELLLDPVGLAAKVGPKGYTITRKSGGDPSAAPRPSAVQAQCSARIQRKLKESRSTYQFDKHPLATVAAFFENLSGENVVLDPKGRMEGKIDPSATVTGSGKDVPLGEALETLLSPMGLRAVVRDEVIVLEAAGGAAGGRRRVAVTGRRRNSISPTHPNPSLQTRGPITMIVPNLRWAIASAAVMAGVFVACHVAGTVQAAPDGNEPAKVFVGYLFAQPRNINFRLYTHIFHAFIVADEEGRILKRGNVPSRELTAAAHKAGVKVVPSLGGWGWDKQFAAIVSKPEAEDRYFKGVMEIVNQYDYDGVDLDWEYPDTKEEVVGFERLTRRFRKAVDEIGQKKGRHMVVTMAASSNPGTLKWLDKAFLLETMDWINVMTYDFTGEWTNYAGHHSPLFASSKQPGTPRSTESSMKFLLEERGLPANRLAVGIPLYGRGFNVARPYDSTKGAPKKRLPRGDYTNLHKLESDPAWARQRDDETKNPWLISKKDPAVIGYDDAESVAIKTEWAMKQGFRGVFFWQVHGDRLPDGANPLQEASHREWEKAAGKKS